MPTRIKICGITRPEDAALAAELGADAIGLNFFVGPRKINFRRASEILADVPPLVTAVALTSGPSEAFPDAPRIVDIQTGYSSLDTRYPLPIHTFQIYGDGGAAIAEIDRAAMSLWGVYHFVDYAGLFACPWMKTFFPDLIVIDTPSDTKLGGTGKAVNWHAVAEAQVNWKSKDLPGIILAGGLGPDNVGHAIHIAKPFAVDVCSGVEITGKPGLKDPIKMRDFIQAVRGAS